MKLKIYQLGVGREAHNVRFEGSGCQKEAFGGIDLDIYREVYASDDEPEADLEGIFCRFNLDRPKDFHGWSLSVSDIVSVDGEWYFVEPFGFLHFRPETERVKVLIRELLKQGGGSVENGTLAITGNPEVWMIRRGGEDVLRLLDGKVICLNGGFTDEEIAEFRTACKWKEAQNEKAV